MPSTPIPELEPRRKPTPELKLPQKKKPEVGEDQGDSGPDRDNPITQNSETSSPAANLDPADAHIGATEGQESHTPAPSGDAFKDEPKQG